MKIFPHLIRILLRLLGYGLVGSLITSITIFILIVERGPDLSVWHHADLDEEYGLDSDIADFNEYLALEKRLFTQLDERVYAQVPQQKSTSINRYSRGSHSDPQAWPVNWNRSFVLDNDNPQAGVLLLHGLSDSPYSLRSMGEQLQQAGALAIGLRIPGHGTAPSGLVEVRWQDMAAAVRLAARHLQQSVGDKPFYLVGYSNGGSLALEYALATLEDSSLPRPSGIVLISPSIAVSGLAAFAVWQARIGHLLGFEKLAWSSVLPEYDPYKYGSFAINAGDLAHRITLHIQNRLTALQGTGELEHMPPILAFQSSVDATVTPEALLANLFARLPGIPRELVLFDINRAVDIDDMLTRDPMTAFRPLLESGTSGFDLTVVTNENKESSRVVALRNEHGGEDGISSTYIADWPAGIYSLSHVALPFPPDDPVYGGPSAAESPGIQLGNLDLRGERGVLRVSGSDLLRLRWNPFHDYMTARSQEFMKLDSR